MVKDINIHIKTPGADKARKNIDDVGRSAKKTGDKVAAGSKKGARQVDDLGKSAGKTKSTFGKLKESIGGWAAGLVGISAIIGGITSAIRTNIQAMKEHARIASQQQKELLGLQFLGDLYKDVDVRERVKEYAEMGRRPLVETAEAYKALRSKGATLTEAQREGIMKEVMEFGRQEPTAPLTDLVDMFTLYVKQTKAKDMNVAQNILRQTIEEAGVAGAGEVSRYFPRFLPIGITGGLTGPQAAGLWAYATGELGSVEEATTGLRAAFLGLQGRGTPEATKMLAGLGVEPGMGFFQQLQKLSAARQAGKFGVKEAELIGGREGMTILMSLLRSPEALGRQIGRIQQVARPDIDLTARALQDLMSKDELARLEEQKRLADIQIENIKAEDIEALKNEVWLAEQEKRMREGGFPEYFIRFQQFLERLEFGTGILEPDKTKRSLMEIYHGIEPPSQNTPVIQNDYSINHYPIVGDEQERGKGPRIEPGVQP